MCNDSITQDQSHNWQWTMSFRPKLSSRVVQSAKNIGLDFLNPFHATRRRLRKADRDFDLTRIPNASFGIDAVNALQSTFEAIADST